MGKLLETFKKIDIGRKKCIDSLNNVNIPTPDDVSLDGIAAKIREKGGTIDFAKENRLWTRPKEWVNTEDLLLNAPELTEYSPTAVFLLHDNRPSITVTLSSPFKIQPNSNYQNVCDAYYLSDGTFLTNPNQSTSSTSAKLTHEWDKSKDIKTSLGYNLRYMIAYVHNSRLHMTTGKNTMFNYNEYGIGISLLEMVYKPIVGRTTWYIPHKSSKNSSVNLQRLHILDGDCDLPDGMSSTMYNNIKEIQIDKSDELQLTRWSLLTGTYQQGAVAKLIIPNATKIKTGSGGSTLGYFSQIYIPNVVSIEQLEGADKYGEFWTIDIYAPKLRILNKNLYVGVHNYGKLISLDDASKLRHSTDVYMNPFIQYITDEEYTLPDNGGVIKTGVFAYNPNIISINNNSSFGGFRVFDFPQLRHINNPKTFSNAVSLNIGQDFKSNLDISSSGDFLSTIDILSILNKLADVTGETETYTLTLGEELLSLLSDEEKAIATNKGWVIA